MQVNITARHFTLSDQLKEFIHIKIKKIEKFNFDIINCNIVLTKEANMENVEIICHSKGHDFVAHNSSNNFEKSFIFSMDKIISQIKKIHDKFSNH